MQESFNIKAIVLNRYSYKENDLRVVLYSKEKGKIELIARGGLKPKSKLAGHIEPIILIDGMVILGRKVNYIGTAIGRNCYVNIKNDSIKLFYAGLVIKIIDRQNKFEDTLNANSIFDLLKDFLDTLNKYNLAQSEYKLLYSFFILKFLTYIGFSPELTHCCKCQNKIKQVDASQGKNYFIVSMGGIACEKCFNSFDNPIEISNDCIKILRFVMTNSLKVVNKLKIDDKKTKNSINYIVDCFYRYHMNIK